MPRGRGRAGGEGLKRALCRSGRNNREQEGFECQRSFAIYTETLDFAMLEVLVQQTSSNEVKNRRNARTVPTNAEAAAPFEVPFVHTQW
jgi:hypothetical protein